VLEVGEAAAEGSQYMGFCDKFGRTHISVRVRLAVSLIAVWVVSITVGVSAISRILIAVVVSHVWARAQLMRE
jgi:hypothetical protein